MYDTLIDIRKAFTRPVGYDERRFWASDINIDEWKESRDLQFFWRYAGVYAFSLHKTQIPYPFDSSRLIYIGKADYSKKTETNLANRIYSHLSEGDGNEAVYNYFKEYEDLEISVVKVRGRAGKGTADKAENRFLDAFREKMGCLPIGNGRRT